MVSFSGTALASNARTNLEAIMGKYDDKIWRLFAYDSYAEKYVEAKDANLSRFDDEFKVGNGNGFWLISRETKNVLIDILTYDGSIGSTTYMLLPPGWSMISHPWKIGVNLLNFDIDVSEDLLTWKSIDDSGNNLTSGSFWQFKGEAGSAGDWYEEKSFSTGTLDPNQSYWIKNLKDYPVALRIVNKTTIANRQISNSPLDIVKLMALNKLLKWIPDLTGLCFASLKDSQIPPDPPGGASGNEDASGQSKGGGGCFISVIN
jgi:hypothetical protein